MSNKKSAAEISYEKFNKFQDRLKNFNDTVQDETSYGSGWKTVKDKKDIINYLNDSLAQIQKEKEDFISFITNNDCDDE